MSLDFTEAPTLPTLSDPETFNDRALALFSWLTGTFIPELEAITGSDIVGGNIDGTAIGANTASTGRFTEVDLADGGRFTSYGSGNDVASVVPGSGFGALLESAPSGNIVIGIRDNGTADTFSIVSGGGDYDTDSTYDTLVATFQAGGNIGFGTTNTEPGKANNDPGAGIKTGGQIFASADAEPALSLNRFSIDGQVTQYRRAGSIVGSVSVTTTATTYNTSSDRRLKSDISDLTGFSARIDALLPRTFTMGGQSAQGFIADEFQEVYPNSVTGTPDGEEMQAMQASTSEVMADLIAEIQSLRARVAALEAG